MLRTTTLFACTLTLALSSLLFGCDGDDDTGLIWYDDEFAACFTDDVKGKVVEVPCEDDDDDDAIEDAP